MPPSARLTIEFEEDLAEKLEAAANERGLAPERLASDCVAQHFEISARFLALLERFEQMDSNLSAIAQFVAEAAAPAESIDLWKICKYRREKEGR